MQNPLSQKTPISLALFASGAGSNVKAIYQYFAGRQDVKVALVVSNRPHAPVLNFAQSVGVPVFLLDREEFYHSSSFLTSLVEHKIDRIVLAGFLWLLPAHLIEAYPGKIINIHPALLPQYGGKGMFGDHVHRAVIQAGDAQSGITIHEVNQHYDEGQILLQATCPVAKDDTTETLALKIHKLEHYFFPRFIEYWVRS
jgi:phosphoribosylglycinamide formyltransferase-1